MKRLSAEQLSRVAVSLVEPSGTTIVLLDEVGVPDIDATIYSSNIYCLSQEGELQWQVQAGQGLYERDAFVSMGGMTTGWIEARRFFGGVYAIDPSTGVANMTGWAK